mgnify:FL=1
MPPPSRLVAKSRRLPVVRVEVLISPLQLCLSNMAPPARHVDGSFTSLDLDITTRGGNSATILCEKSGRGGLSHSGFCFSPCNMSRANAARRSSDSALHGGVELADQHDRELLRNLNRRISTFMAAWQQPLGKQSLNGDSATYGCCWHDQAMLLARRMAIVFRTLQTMPTNAAPSPRLLSVYHSAEYLFSQLSTTAGDASDSSSAAASVEAATPPAALRMILRHYDGCHLFQALSSRLKQCWSLQSTASWPAEDREARDSDRRRCDRIVAASESRIRALLPPVWTKQHPATGVEGLVAWLAHRSLSGWKIDYADIDASDSLASCSTGAFPAAGAVTGVVTAAETTPSQPTRASTVVNVRYAGDPVVLAEWPVTARLEDDSTDAFVVDAVLRRAWIHPRLVPFYGAFTSKESVGSRGADDGCVTAFGCVMRDMSADGYESLHSALFVGGKRFGLVDIIDMLLQVADAVQYIAFDGAAAGPATVRSWLTLSPNGIFVRATPSALPVAGDLGEGGAGNGAIVGTTNHYLVSLAPSVHLSQKTELVSRWTPPPVDRLAGPPEVYSLTLLLVAIITGACPYAAARTQDDINSLVGNAAVPYALASLHLPARVALFCERGLRLKEAAPPDAPKPSLAHSFVAALSRTFSGVAFDPPSGPQLTEDATCDGLAPFSSLNEFRSVLFGLRATVAHLPVPVGGHAVVPPASDAASDFGSL